MKELPSEKCCWLYLQNSSLSGEGQNFNQELPFHIGEVSLLPFKCGILLMSLKRSTVCLWKAHDTTVIQDYRSYQWEMGVLPDFLALRCLCVCVCSSLFIVLVHKHLGQVCFDVIAQLEGGALFFVDLSALGGGTGIISHDLWNKFGCIYLK